MSPPRRIFGLRAYLPEGHPDRDKEIGREETPDEYVDRMVGVFRGVRRALHPSGVLWLNLGDGYVGGGGYSPDSPSNKAGSLQSGRGGSIPGKMRPGVGLKSKDLIGVPWMVACALRADGWYLRQWCPWLKRNGMPDSAEDRPAAFCEHVFLLSKEPDYFFDHVAVRRPSAPSARTGPTETPSPKEKKREEDGMQPGLSGDYGDGHNWRNSELWFDSVGMLLAGDDRTVLGFDVPTRPYRGAHFACVDESTEMLTASGWKKHADVAVGDVAAQYDLKSGVLSWDFIRGVHRYEVRDQEMVTATSRDVDMVLTPNHRTIVRSHRAQTRHGHPSRVRLVRADELKLGQSIPVGGEWSVPQSDAPVTEDEAELIGWALAEGSFYKNGVRIYQSDSANPVKVDRIRGLLGRVDADWKESVVHRTYRDRPHDLRCFRVRGRVAAMLHRWCRVDHPDWEMMGWSVGHLIRLFDGVIDGDGHRRGSRVGFTQVSEAVTDFVQAVGFRLGYSTKKSVVGVGVAVGAAAGYQRRASYRLYFTRKSFISLRGTNAGGGVLGTTLYTGVVWCPELPAGTFVARRGGRVFITGNTMPPDLVRPMIQSGTPERGVCPGCGEPWRRVVEKDRVPTRPGKDTKVTDRGRAAPTDGTSGEYSADGRAQFRSSDEVGNRDPRRHCTKVRTVGWEPGCRCRGNTPVPAVVIDPFAGAGTTLLVARQLGRRAAGCELNKDYAAMARRRVGNVLPTLF